MAKNFPYFKFIATEWLTGNIVYESLSAQGLFINICATYWQRNGKLSLEEVNRRYKNPVELSELTDRFFLVKEGLIIIKFLDEQLIEAGHVSKKNSENGRLGGRPKTLKTMDKKPTAKPTESQLKAKKSKEEEEEKKNKKENKIPTEIEFLNFCKEIKEIDFSMYEFSLKAKYEAWVGNSWKDGNNNKITNWKTKIKNTIPFLNPQKSKFDKPETVSQMTIGSKNKMPVIQQNQ